MRRLWSCLPILESAAELYREALRHKVSRKELATRRVEQSLRDFESREDR